MTKPVEIINIKIVESLGTSLCVSIADGTAIYKLIFSALKTGKQVNLSFAGITSITSAFLNPAVGQLYGKFDENFIRTHLKICEIATDDLFILERVIKTAKQYFKNKEQIQAARNIELGDPNAE